MEKQTEKIMRFSKVIYVLLNIALIVFIVICVLEAVAWLWSVLKLHTGLVTINGVEMEAPLLFRLGGTSVYMPVMWQSGFDFSNIKRLVPGFSFAVGFEDFLGTIFTIISLRFTKRVFKLLRENGSPFRDDVVRALKGLTIILLCTGCVSGAIPFLAAGIVWVLCLVFDYGRMLQNESDTTL